MRNIKVWVLMLIVFFVSIGESYAQKKFLDVEIELADKFLPFAELSQEVYEDNPRPSGWKVIQTTSVVNKSGLFGVAFRNRKTGEVAFAFRGSTLDEISPESRKDLKADFSVGALRTTDKPHVTAQYSEGLDFVKKTIRTFGLSKNQVTVTGHSLGGGIAEFTAAKLGLKAYTFNSIGVDSEYVQAHKHELNGSKIVNLKTKGEKASGLPGGAHLGRSVTVNFGKGHKIGPLVKNLKEAKSYKESRQRKTDPYQAYNRLYSQQRERRILRDLRAASRDTKEVINETVILGDSGTGTGITLTFTSPNGGGTSNITSIINGARNLFASVLFGSSVERIFASGNSISIELECVANAPCQYTVNASGGTIGGQSSVTRSGQALNAIQTFVVVSN